MEAGGAVRTLRGGLPPPSRAAPRSVAFRVAGWVLNDGTPLHEEGKIGAFILSSSGTAHAKQRLGAQVLAREKELCPIADSSA